MPANPKTTDEQVIEAARSIIADGGVDGLSMQAIGSAVGVKAPSLYKRFESREAIVRGVQLAEFAELGRSMQKAVEGLSPTEALRAIALSYWRLAHDRPRIYEILFTGASLTAPEDVAVRTEAMMPAFHACRSIVGPGTALPAARMVSAYIHGFISMYLSGAFQQTGGIEGSYYYGLNAIIRGLVGVQQK